MPTFGYTSSGGGFGGSDVVVFWDFANTYPHTRFYPYTNNSGSPVLVDTATLLNVLAGVGRQCEVLVYDSINQFGGLPERLIGQSDTLASLGTGLNTFTFSTPFIVDVGTRVWVAVIANGSTSISVSGAQRTISESVEWGIQKDNWGWTAPNPFPGTSGWDRTNIAIPIDLSGSVATLPSTDMRESLYVHEPLTEGVPDLLESLYVHEPLAEGVPNLLESLYVHEPLAEGTPGVRCSLFVLETLHNVEPEPFMATETLPVLTGLSFNVSKTPSFSTRKPRSVNGKTTRSALMPYPIWRYKFHYDYLPDRPVSVGQTSLKQLVGFFLSRQGSFDEWLYLDPDDNTVTLGQLGVGDGVTVQFPLTRSFGGFYEPVGQLDTHYAHSIYVNGVLQTDGVDYNILMPNQVIFTTAPANTLVITASFHFYYRVIFSEDSNEFEKFMDKLWQLQEMTFESVP